MVSYKFSDCGMLRWGYLCIFWCILGYFVPCDKYSLQRGDGYSFLVLLVEWMYSDLIGVNFEYPGPNLNGLFGRQSGTTAGYSYSAANKGKAVIWEENTLYDYLLNPKKVLTIFFAQPFSFYIEFLCSCVMLYKVRWLKWRHTKCSTTCQY